MTGTSGPWVQVFTIGDAAFGILVGGPFDGRCYPLPHPAPEVLQVPGLEPGAGALRYVLREGYYRYAGAVRDRPAA
jgi:hypothetical protein